MTKLLASLAIAGVGYAAGTPVPPRFGAVNATTQPLSFGISLEVTQGNENLPLAACVPVQSAAGYDLMRRRSMLEMELALLKHEELNVTETALGFKVAAQIDDVTHQLDGLPPLCTPKQRGTPVPEATRVVSPDLHDTLVGVLKSGLAAVAALTAAHQAADAVIAASQRANADEPLREVHVHEN